MAQSRFLRKDYGGLNLHNDYLSSDSGILSVDGSPVGGTPTVPYTSGALTVTDTAVGIGNENPSAQLTIGSDNHISIDGENALIENNSSLTISAGGDLILVADSSQINVMGNRIVNILNPVDAADVANKHYVDTAVGGAGSSLSSTTVTLTPSDIASLNTYPGITLVPAVGGQQIIVHRLDFYMHYSGTPYSSTANLFLNYDGNWSASWLIPAGGNVTAPLLTASRDTYYSAFNTATQQYVLPGSAALLMSDGTITGGNSNLIVRVIYELIDPLI